MYAKLVASMGTDLTVVNSARISFNKESEELDRRDEKLIAYLASHDHMSPFEHCIVTVEIKVPIYISKQIMRYRSFSYNEVSRRYTSDELEFYTPSYFNKQSKDNRQASDGALPEDINADLKITYGFALEAACETYWDLIEQGVSREEARGVLPQATYTRFIMTGSLRNWVHFVKQREHHSAQVQIQYIAREIKKILQSLYPVASAALFKDPSCHSKTPSAKLSTRKNTASTKKKPGQKPVGALSKPSADLSQPTKKKTSIK